MSEEEENTPEKDIEKNTSINEKGTEDEKNVEDIDYFKDKLLRAQADVQNIRRRMQEDTEERVRIRMESLLSDLIRIADYLEAGLAAIPDSIQKAQHADAFLAGISAIQQELDRVFQFHGVTFISPQENDIFDPKNHEAVETTEDEGLKEPKMELLSRGYSMGNKILRPAKVRVIANKGDAS